MTSLFRNLRAYAFVLAAVASIIVLSLSANFATKFLPLHQDYLIFSIVASGVTIVILLLLALRSTPLSELIGLFFLLVLWLAMGGYSTDVIGRVECDSLTGQIPAGHGNTYSAGGYCRQTKVVQSFSWANFMLFSLMFLITLSLSLKAHARGFKKIWLGDINDLGWFDELQNNPQPYLPLSQQPGQSYVYPNVTTFGNSQPVYQLPGHSVVITTGPNGQQSFVPQPVPQPQGGPGSINTVPGGTGP
ncbi:hypothetical protein BS47DRAFT_800120 [Hydnum rufescens UP504]|uniref:MARVEL domain-containing protein n=1 Tax=Hydnum rufescens UP504 TaxID=1448309 RepID=A0A9P6B051_9AGAM|nr:hypothetical protein BS47DRAFT_800120 [Hydnum rufescens UP504]